jgi:hypothetical protein
VSCSLGYSISWRTSKRSCMVRRIPTEKMWHGCLEWRSDTAQRPFLFGVSCLPMHSAV